MKPKRENVTPEGFATLVAWHAQRLQLIELIRREARNTSFASLACTDYMMRFSLRRLERMPRKRRRRMARKMRRLHERQIELSRRLIAKARRGELLVPNFAGEG